MTFSLKRVIADADFEPFEFEGVDGETVQLPHIQTLTGRHGLMALNGRLDQLMDEIAPELKDQIVDLPAFAQNELLKAWLDHGGLKIDENGQVVPGKSETPSPSSKTTRPATPSKRTSRSAASRSRK